MRALDRSSFAMEIGYTPTMPELPEVEILVRHLAPLLPGRRVRAVVIGRPRVTRPDPPDRLVQALTGATFRSVTRRGKYLIFGLTRGRRPLSVVGHLGMTGRMWLQSLDEPLPRHLAAALDLGRQRLVFEDVRFFGRLSLDLAPVAALGPEPLDPAWDGAALAARLGRATRPIKVCLLDQAVVAGVGNIYASEALHRARIAPTRPAARLRPAEREVLARTIREVLAEAVAGGSTVPLDLRGGTDGLYYYGRAAEAGPAYGERLAVYDREGSPCWTCGRPIRRTVQAGRSTFHCPRCQR
jgi:formamidopyrimidine-DNA glycosylase